MNAPQTIKTLTGNVPGFIAVTKPRGADTKKLFRGDTLWRPAGVLSGKDDTGTLIAEDENNNFQGTPATMGLYRVKDPVAAWFSTATRERIA